MTSKLTRERLQEIAEDGFLKHGESKELARMALAAMDGEPVFTLEVSQADYKGQKLGNHFGFITLDAARKLEEGNYQLYRHAQPAPEYPETLPCPVLLEPGLRFGKGIKTSTMLAALARRAVYESDMAALSPEEIAEFQARIEDFKALIAQPAPVVPAVSDDIGEIRVGRLPTMNQDDYPGLGDWWVQLRIGEDSDEVLARVYGATPQEANNRAEALACRAAMLAAAPQLFGSEPATVPGKWIPVSEKNPDCWCLTCRPVTLNDMRFVVCPDCGNKRCPRANDHRNACTGSNEPGQGGSAYPDTPREVKP
ncbi:DUF551 domain-containing protein [Klebsiella pneumoniae]|nr:DUF551 domain-containing protein [Klebsiella pneumoniae]